MDSRDKRNGKWTQNGWKMSGRVGLENAAKELPSRRCAHGQLDEGSWMKARMAELQEMSPDACRLRKSPITQEEVCN